MAVKRASPFTSRTILPFVDVNDANSHSLSDKVLRPLPMMRSRLRSASGNGPSSVTIANVPLDLVIAILVWYIVGVGSIVTTKILLTKEHPDSEGTSSVSLWAKFSDTPYGLPPLVLTFQQLLLGSSLIWLGLYLTGGWGANGIQPLPKVEHPPTPTSDDTPNKKDHYSLYYDFVLMGLFNALDFLASNTSFSHSAASFVETIKASEPLTTTAIALFFGIDQLHQPEALSMAVLIVGVFCSTMGNTQEQELHRETVASETDELGLHESTKTAVIVMTANICFALRAKSQKLFRAQPDGKTMNDANLLMRMQQIGAISLAMPLLAFEFQGVFERTLAMSLAQQAHYWVLAIGNAAAFCTYSLASCYVLTKLSVVQHTGLGCLRRMFAILFTSVVFGIPISPLGGLGIVLCFTGFCSFTYFRYKPKTTITRRQVLSPPSSGSSRRRLRP